MGNQVIDDAKEIKEAVFNHFRSFFTRRTKTRPILSCHLLPKLNERDRKELEEGFSVEDIWVVVRDIYGSKAPGLW